MSSRELPALIIEPGESAAVAVASGAIHTLACASVWLVPLPIPLALALALACGLGLWRSLRTILLREDPQAVRRITWQAGRGWRLEDRSGCSRTACLLPSSFVAPWLLVLNWATAGGERTVILHPGNAPDSLRRRLAAGLAARWAA